jgi:Fe-S cluster assembly iron-binding protein IscA
MNYANNSDVEGKKFELVESHNIKVLVDPLAIFYILGTEMDYEVVVLSPKILFSLR